MKWIDTTVGEYCPFVYGKSLPQRNRENGNVPVYGSNGIVDYHKTPHVKGCGIIIGRKGSVGAIHLSKSEFWPIDTSFYIEKDSIDELYFTYYLLKSLGLEHMNSDSAVPGLNRDNAHALTIRIPESSNDRKLLGYWVAKFDKKIELNTQTNQTLEQIAQAIFKSWFVDFDPVKAKIETLAAGGSADDAELAAMSVISAKTVDELNSLKASNPEAFKKLAQTAALFPAAMQDSELGEIPEGWEVSEIGNEVIVVGGGTPSTKNIEFWEDGTIHWTTPKDMSGLNCKVLTNTDRKITEAGLKKISSGLLSENTVLMSSRAPVGYLALAKIPVAINQGYIAMKCEGRLSPEYVLLWCEQNMEEIKQRASGTTFAEISKANFKPIPVIVPVKSIIDTFTVQVSDIYNFVHSNALQSETLSISRDLLLPKLLSDELSDVFKDGE
ncbi:MULTISPECIES: restriction endonuclease subunit S [Vibrio]|uniref:Restriction endonuclease subunit S n=1 Tax=Vibrio chanodichtyis TaxID=3027932 RepID=A0ABT5UW85_9VIBR|nr:MULTISPECIES: restriction endonuclease subunit S [Vibrio]MDE1513685.1 restriction endonuclease subunit S [Vibrio chanodichtyis]